MSDAHISGVRQSIVPIVLFALVYFIFRSFYFDYFPLWDGRAYFEGAANAQSQPFNILNYSISDHNSQAWNFLSGLPNYFFLRNHYAYNVWGALLSTMGVVAFYAIVGELACLAAIERLMVTALFAYHPSLLSNHISLSADTGLLLFWIGYLFSLLKNKKTLAVIFGCLLLFTKPTALMHLAIVFIFCALRQPASQRMAWMRRYSMAAWFPYALYGFFLLYKLYMGRHLFFFTFFLPQWAGAFAILPERSLITFAMIGLLLNFNWVLTSLIVSLGVRLRRMPKNVQWNAYKAQAPAMLWLLGATLFAVLLIRHYSNVRYLLPFFAVMIVCIAYLLPVITKPKSRFAVLALLLGGFIVQDFRSVDPVSNNVFCTTPFGSHRVLAITSLDKVCYPGEEMPRLLGDRLVYNLEFTHVSQLLKSALQDIRPDNKTNFILENQYNFMLFFWFDKNGHPTSTDFENSPTYYNTSDMKQWNSVNQAPETLYYLQFPTEPHNPSASDFKRLYKNSSTKTYSEDGYELKVIKYTDRSSIDWCDPE